ncbi:MAG TPA: LptE family protein [Bryobacteraceae bacterium]|nr:LptE family protein [Bryobacteraceae bacterium]
MKALAACLALAAASAGCGYRVGGQSDLMPKAVHTIAIPPFRNATVRYRLASLLPEDIAREFNSRSHYVIVTDVSKADALLQGSLAAYNAYATVTDPVTGRATMYQVEATLDLTLTDRRTGKVLFSRRGQEFWDRYEVALDPNEYFDESSTAMQRVSRSVARAVVTAILQGF